MTDRKYMMRFAQMKEKLCMALQVDLSELDVFFIQPIINPSDPLIGYGYFGAAIKKGKSTVRSILFIYRYKLMLSTVIKAIVTAPAEAWVAGGIFPKALHLKQRRPRAKAS